MDTGLEAIGRITGLPFVVGIKPYATFFVFGLLLRTGYVVDPFFLGARFEFFKSTAGLAIFGFLFLIDTFADKIPVVDHISDLIHTVLKPIAGALLGFVSVGAVQMSDLLGIISVAMAVVGGGAIALATHVTKATMRVASTKFTAGFANPAISFGEDVLVAVGTFALVRHPAIFGVIILVFLVIFCVLAPRIFAAFRLITSKGIAFFRYWMGLDQTR